MRNQVMRLVACCIFTLISSSSIYVETNGQFPSVLTNKPAEESDLKLAVSVQRPVFRIGESILGTPFFEFELSEPAFVIAYVIAPQNINQTQLLVPNRNQHDNFFLAGQHAFNQAITMGSDRGIYHIQVIASKFPIGKPLIPEFSPETNTGPLFPSIQSPGLAHSRLERVVAELGLLPSEWAATTVSFELDSDSSRIVPASEGLGALTVEVFDVRLGNELTSTPEISVTKEGSGSLPFAVTPFQPINLAAGDWEVNVRSETYGEQTKIVTIPENGTVNLRFDLVANMFTDNPDFEIFDSRGNVQDTLVLFAGTQYRFQADSSGIFLIWNFGDSTEISGPFKFEATHTFQAAGVYEVELRSLYSNTIENCGESEIDWPFCIVRKTITVVSSIPPPPVPETTSRYSFLHANSSIQIRADQSSFTVPGNSILLNVLRFNRPEAVAPRALVFNYQFVDVPYMDAQDNLLMRILNATSFVQVKVYNDDPAFGGVLIDRKRYCTLNTQFDSEEKNCRFSRPVVGQEGSMRIPLELSDKAKFLEVELGLDVIWNFGGAPIEVEYSNIGIE